MTLRNKILTVLGLLLLSLLVFNTIRMNNKINDLQNQKDQTEQTANLEIGRAHTTVANAESKIKLLDSQVQQDIKSHKALLDSYSSLEAKYNTKGSGTITIKVPTETEKVYVKVNGTPMELKTYPFAFDDFRLHADGDAITKEFKYTLNQKFEVQLADTKLKSGVHNHYAELYELDSSGKRVGKLTLTKFEVTDSENDIRNQFKWFDWRLDLGIAYHIHRNFEHGIAGELGLSMMSYGKPSMLKWRFLRGSVGLDSAGVFVALSPLQYNLGDPLPLFSNLWLTPTIGYNMDIKTYFLGFGLSVIL